MDKPKVYIVDDDQAVLDSLCLLMKSEQLPCVHFQSAQEFLDQCTPETRGCLVLDVGMPRMSGLQLQQRLKQLHANIPIIFITGHGDVPMAVQAIQEGALDFLQKPFSNADLLKRIRAALAQLEHQDPEPVPAASLTGDNTDPINRLTERERQILDCIVSGLSNKVIGRKLCISTRTVETHRANIMQKLRVQSVAELVRLALAHSHPA